MGRSCKQCKQKGGSDGRTLHGFPLDDDEVLEIWRKRLNLPPSFSPTKYTRICSDHFPDKCFKFTEKTKTLIAGSVPEFFTELKHACFYCKATKETNPGISLRKFPLNKPEMLKKWLREINVKNFVPDKDTRICSNHFEKSSFAKVRTRKRLNLKETAIPTIFEEQMVIELFEIDEPDDPVKETLLETKRVQEIELFETYKPEEDVFSETKQVEEIELLETFKHEEEDFFETNFIQEQVEEIQLFETYKPEEDAFSETMITRISTRERLSLLQTKYINLQNKCKLQDKKISRLTYKVASLKELISKLRQGNSIQESDLFS